MEMYSRLSALFALLLWSNSLVYSPTIVLGDHSCGDFEPLDGSKFVINYTVTSRDEEWVLRYDIRWEPADIDHPFREDGRCSSSFLAPSGKRAECDPNGTEPCCSPHFWCGSSADHCDCAGCIDYREEAFRDDSRCGPFLAPNGFWAQCNPYGNGPCCSYHGWCGVGAEHCECEGCIDYREQLFYAKLIFDDTVSSLEPWALSNCSADGPVFSTEDTYSNVQNLVAEAPFTHRALLQVAYVTVPGILAVPPPITRATNIFLETPDCYAETKDAEFCASQSVVRCGQPRDVSLVEASREGDAIKVELEWKTPVQVNVNMQMHSYGVVLRTADGDMVITDSVDVLAGENVTTWESEGDNQGVQENVEYILMVTPYVQNKLDPASPPVAGRLVTYSFAFELNDTTTIAVPTVIIPDPAEALPLIVIPAIAMFVLAAVLIACALLLLLLRKRRHSRDGRDFQNLEMYGKNNREQVREVDPLLKHKEVSPDLVTIKHKLGEGEFGIVHKGLLRVVEKGKMVEKEVAIKTTKVGAHYDAREDLLSEMKLIAELGDHPNILHLVACCSIEEPYYLITEFMQFGDLLGFLRKCRTANDENLEPIYNVGELEQLIIARGIAKGMAHIQAKKFYHGDLAARNVLIGEELTVKISDFGLADDLYTRGYKRREEEQKIPIKWCSIETILNGICSSQGDVWSFGILLYEVFTLGGTPYPGVAPRFLVTQLRQGYRMERPDGCPDDVYDLMKCCWQVKPEERPVFSLISEQLADMLMKRTDYIEFEVTGDDEEQRYVSTPTKQRKSLAPINDENNELDIDQLHSVLNAEKEVQA